MQVPTSTCISTPSAFVAYRQRRRNRKKQGCTAKNNVDGGDWDRHEYLPEHEADYGEDFEGWVGYSSGLISSLTRVLRDSCRCQRIKGSKVEVQHLVRMAANGALLPDLLEA